MWLTKDYSTNKEVIWYSEEEYKALESKLEKYNKILYNINELSKFDGSPLGKYIDKELEKWKSLNA